MAESLLTVVYSVLKTNCMHLYSNINKITNTVHARLYTGYSKNTYFINVEII